MSRQSAYNRVIDSLPNFEGPEIVSLPDYMHRSSDFTPHRDDANGVQRLRDEGVYFLVDDEWRVTAVMASCTFTDANAKSLSHLPKLRGFSLIASADDGPLLSDIGIADMLRETALVDFRIDGNRNVSDTVMPAIVGHRSLRKLSLLRTSITDRSIPALAKATQIKILTLTGNRLTNAAIPDLCRLTHLQYLSIEDTDISQDGLDHLRQKLPCIVNFPAS